MTGREPWWPRMRELMPIAVIINSVGIAVAFILIAFAFDSIQNQRRTVTRLNCQDVNERHDNTIRQFDRLLAQAARGGTPEETERARQSRAGTVLLLNAIIPKRDCGTVANRVVSP